MGEYDRCVFDSDAFCESLLPGDPVLVVGGQYNGARVTFVRLTPKKVVLSSTFWAKDTMLLQKQVRPPDYFRRSYQMAQKPTSPLPPQNRSPLNRAPFDAAFGADRFLPQNRLLPQNHIEMKTLVQAQAVTNACRQALKHAEAAEEAAAAAVEVAAATIIDGCDRGSDQ